MGIFCEIQLYKPSDGAFTPGSTVSGSIRYAIDEETVFKKITVSLNGIGHLALEEQDKKNKGMNMTHRNHEDYINVYNVIHDNEKQKKATPIGTYETQFNYKLPEKIPSTLHYLRRLPRYVVRCNIKYHIQIRFERPGFLKFDKTFKKEITVISGITPRLPTVETICGEQKTLFQFFASKKSIVNIKATIKSCVLKPGDKIEFAYKVANDTNLVLKHVETKLLEVYHFTSKGGREVSAYQEIKDTDSKTGSIKIGESKSMKIEIPTPTDLNSLDHSNMVKRDYVVRIIAGIPMPHRDAVLEIPIQIGDVDVPIKEIDAPPPYWKAMAEDDGNVFGGSDTEVAEEVKEVS